MTIIMISDYFYLFINVSNRLGVSIFEKKRLLK